MLRSIEFPLRFIGLDDHTLGIFGTDILFRSYLLLLLSLMSTFKNKNSLRTIEAEEARRKFTGSYIKKKRVVITRFRVQFGIDFC